MSDSPFVHTHQPPGIPRTRRAGTVIWRLVDPTGRVQTCELHDDTKVDAGWDVLILVDGEPYFSRRCPDRERATFYAEAMRQDNVRTGWRELTH